MLRCPAHNDKNPSLSLGLGRDGRILLHCYAGCKLDDILGPWGLKSSDLFPRIEIKVVAEYIYHDADGKESYKITRTDPKGFFVAHRKGKRWEKGLAGVRRVPYRLPKLKEAVKSDHTVFLLEGEKDCDNFVKAFKLTATTFPFGANKWQKHYTQYFKKARVVIIPDNDKPGHEHAQMVAHKLESVANKIKIVELPNLPDKGDMSDWIDLGGTKEQLKELVEATPLWEPKPVTELSEIELAIKAKIEELNRKYATAMVRGKYVILEPDRMDPSLQCSSVEIIHPSSLTSKFAHDKITVGYKADNKPIVKNAVSVWLESPDRRNYEGIVFDPGVDHGSQYFNYWRGFSLKPKEGKIDLYLQHIHEVIADGDTAVYDHIIALMADAVQLRPRPGVALAIIGQQGVGKGVFVNNFGRLFGAHYLHISQNSHLIGKFNRHLAEGMIVFVDEAFWAGDKAAEGVLKALITEDRMMIEAKGVDAIQIKNHTRIFMASNNDWIVPAGLEERRFFVVKASEKYIGNQDYFGRLQQQMDRGGHAALLLYLQQFELDGINLSAFPRTEALASQKVLSMGLVEKFYYHLLKEGILFRSNGDFDLEKSQTPWGQGEVSTSIIYTAFLDYIKSDPRNWFSGPEGFGIEIKRLVPTIVKKRIKGQACYIFPSLKECRDSFDQRTKQDWGWPED